MALPRLKGSPLDPRFNRFVAVCGAHPGLDLVWTCGSHVRESLRRIAKEELMFSPSHVRHEDPAYHLDYLLRRAEQESIAAIRSINPVAAERHDIMAHAYSAQALTMLGQMNAGCGAG